MSVPKRRTSRMRVRTRRSHNALTPANLSSCPRCKEPLRPHTVCGNCGWYRDGTVIDVEAESETETDREKKKE